MEAVGFAKHAPESCSFSLAKAEVEKAKHVDTCPAFPAPLFNTGGMGTSSYFSWLTSPGKSGKLNSLSRAIDLPRPSRFCSRESFLVPARCEKECRTINRKPELDAFCFLPGPCESLALYVARSLGFTSWLPMLTSFHLGPRCWLACQGPLKPPRN